MSYTNVEQIQRYLVAPYPVSDQMYDQRLILSGIGNIRIHGTAVSSTSVSVKSIQSNDLTRTEVTLTAGDNLLTSQPIVPGSLVVASDSSLGLVYTENVDYIADYQAGSLAFKSGGALGIGQSVTVWYLPYTVYLVNVDYQLQSNRAEIKRLASGSIADGETVFLDYQPVYLSVSQELIESAVISANGMIENELDPDRQFEADSTLSAAATSLALEIACRAAASRELASLRGDDRSAVAWMKLADQHAARAEKLIRGFRPPFENPRTPTHS